MIFKKQICIILVILIIPKAIFSETIYLKTREKIVCKIMGETELVFQVRKEGQNYSVFYKHDEIKKAEIFVILDDEGNIIYPRDKIIQADKSVVDKLSDREYQAYLIQLQIQQQEELNKTVGDVRNILAIQLILVIVGGIALTVATKE